MAITKEMILKAVEGKAAERYLETERRGDLVFITYPEVQDVRQDNLHKQSIRALVRRMAPDWMVHLDSLSGLTGFTVEVRLKPSMDGPIHGKSPSDKRPSADELERMAKELTEMLTQLRSG